MTNKEKIISLGWKYVGSCMCNGTETKKFELHPYKLRVTKSKFLISKSGRRSEKHPISELEKVLNEIDQNNKAIISQEAEIQIICE